MTVFVALLRAVNVGGTAKLPMEELRALCRGLGLEQVETFIQSGNIVFCSQHPEKPIVAVLEQALAQKLTRPVGVLVRKSTELQQILAANPFPGADPSRVGVMFLPEPPAASALAGLTTAGREQTQAMGREIFIHYPDGMGRSKLKIPAQLAKGTVRNVNTVQKLAAITLRRAAR